MVRILSVARTHCKRREQHEHRLAGCGDSAGGIRLQPDRVETAVYVESFSGDAAGEVAEEVGGGLADLVGVDVALEGGLARDVLEDLFEPADAAGAEGFDG